MDPGNFFAELKRRNVYKVAVAYALVGWLLIQVAAATFPFLQIPEWGTRLVIVLVFLTFPIALILAWAFELTPTGIQRTPDSVPPSVAVQKRGRKYTMVIAVAGIAIAGLAAFQFFRTKSAGGRNDKSIAVLPFENRSPEKENAYFADGVQDEILTRLAKIADLKVISRTSTQQYKSAPENLRDVGRQLGVSHILEGSVQKSGQSVRLNVQLIRTEDDAHVWAEIYDRKLTDVFAIQSEIANTIAEALKAKLTGAEKQVIALRLTENAEAYDAYLRAIAFNREGTSPASAGKAVHALEEAVRLDPNFAAAWGMLARIHSRVFFNNIDATESRQQKAEQALAAALRLQPDLAESQLAQAFYQYWVLHDYDGARDRFERLRPEMPNNADVLEVLAYITRRQGFWAEADAYLSQAVSLNPRDRFLRMQVAAGWEFNRNYAEALRLYDEALKIWPNDTTLLARKAGVYQAMGELDKAEALLKSVVPNPDNSGVMARIYDQALLRRHYDDAIPALQKAVAQATAVPQRNEYRLWLADLERLRGDAPAAAAGYRTARSELEELLKSQPQNLDVLDTLALVCAGLGDQESALRHAEEAVRLMPTSRDALAGRAAEVTRALVYTRFGDAERAIPALERLLKLPGGRPPITPATLRLHPEFDPLRNDPRFEQLLASLTPK
ncbi:MAG TPA: tetratricopeptide repeat protein [Chthoniobacterales bacterium]|nr:tetratricopeptide repeat protein [Chthoniobacterales bacterium]